MEAESGFVSVGEAGVDAAAILGSAIFSFSLLQPIKKTAKQVVMIMDFMRNIFLNVKKEKEPCKSVKLSWRLQ
jgi:hypothetical protein